jgi:hypothetical protein
MCLNEAYSKVSTGKYFSDVFTVQNGLKQGNVFIIITYQLCFGTCS